MNLKEKLKSWFNRETDQSLEIPEAWRQDQIEEEEELEVVFEGQPQTLKLRKKWRIPGLGKGKAILSWFLFLAHMAFTLGTWSQGAWQMTLFFGGTSFIILDYIYRFRRPRLPRWGDKKKDVEEVTL